MKLLIGILSLCIISRRIVVQCKYFPDEVNSIVYDLSLSAFPLNGDAKDDKSSEAAAGPDGRTASDFVTIGNKHGQEYRCRMPAYVERPQAEEGLLDPPSSPKVTNEEVQNALDALLKKPCMKRTPDWWTYEFCYKDGVRQYHLEGNQRQGETIVLGRFESEKDWTKPESLAELTSKQKKTLYHSHYYTNGTVCDLNNKFRRTEVRFYCDEDLVSLNEAYLQYVNEPESCQYVLTVQVGALCRLPAFLPVDRKPTPLKIDCQPVLNAHEFDKYIKDKQIEEAKKEEEAAERKHKEEQRQLALEAEAAKTKIDIDNAALKQDAALKSEPPEDSGQSQSAATTPKPTFPLASTILGKLDLSKEDSDVFDPTATFGEEGTIEYEYMTDWLENALKDLAMDKKVIDANSKIDADKTLTDEEKETVNEFKRKTRRVSLSVTFGSQLEILVDDVLHKMFTSSFLELDHKRDEIILAKYEIRLALTKAFTNLLENLDLVERDLEMLDEPTDLSGLAAFNEMREQELGRENLLREWEESKANGLSGADFIKAKIAAMPKLTEEQLKQFEEEEEKELAKEANKAELRKAKREILKSDRVTGAKKAPPVEDNPARQNQQTKDRGARDTKGRQSTKASWDKLIKDAKLPVESRGGDKKQDKDVELATGEKAEELEKKTLRQEMESQLKQIMDDVEKELNEEDGPFSDLDEADLAEAKTEAFHTLAKTLTNLLAKLDQAEREADAAKQQLDKLQSKKQPKLESNAERKLNIWRKLIEGLDDDELETETVDRKPLGKIQMKKGTTANSETANSDGLRVRVSTIKPTGGGTGSSGGVASNINSKLEQQIADKLKESGFDTQGRSLQVKIITNLNLDDNNGDNYVHVLSEEESEQVSNVILSMFSGASVEQTVEQRRQRSLEDSYNFGDHSQNEAEESSEKKRDSTMKTIVVGG